VQYALRINAETFGIKTVRDEVERKERRKAVICDINARRVVVLLLEPEYPEGVVETVTECALQAEFLLEGFAYGVVLAGFASKRRAVG
jgi:hypothetical protein